MGMTAENVAEVIGSMTGIPVTKLTEGESERLMKLEETLHARVIGQNDAVVAISKAIRRARVGLKSPNRPIGSFIFCGYGLACYRLVGITYAVLIGLMMVIALYLFCRWWFASHPRGPLEGLWRKLTWLQFK